MAQTHTGATIEQARQRRQDMASLRVEVAEEFKVQLRDSLSQILGHRISIATAFQVLRECFYFPWRFLLKLKNNGDERLSQMKDFLAFSGIGRFMLLLKKGVLTPGFRFSKGIIGMVGGKDACGEEDDPEEIQRLENELFG